MNRNLFIIALAAMVIGLPFLLRREAVSSSWSPGDPELVVITAHNEAIRYEFGLAFSAWHEAEYGVPVRVDWRVVGGTSEIMRYLESEYTSAFRGYWKAEGGRWNADLAGAITDRRFVADPEREDPETLAAYTAFRTTDDPDAFSSEIDVFFGGGEYDHNKAGRQGLSVPAWPEGNVPAGIFVARDGAVLIPEGLSGERWRGTTFVGTALSTFGICYNLDRLRDLGIDTPPSRWDDLADPDYARQLGLADPTKSGSISKAFEMIIHQKINDRIVASGFNRFDIETFETLLDAGNDPAGIPEAYSAALELGWRDGIHLVQTLGANARYFTDSASKVPVDVSTGDAAAGLVIDFYGRYQAEVSRGTDGEERMRYVTPVGGSSVSADPISLLRGAPHRALAVRFIEFVLGEHGQRLWNYRPGTPGGPEKFALRRLPIRSDFYPGFQGDTLGGFDTHAPYYVDPLGDPSVNPYDLASRFTYYPRWTGRHFSIHRDLIRAMCLDAGNELREAWQTIIAHGGPEANPEAMRILRRLPDWPSPLTWESVLTVPQTYDRLDYMREWTTFFRDSYREAAQAASAGRPAP